MAYLAGALMALREAGIDPDSATLIVGTSAGAVVGALLRSGVAPELMLDIVQRSGLSGRLRRLVPRSAANLKDLFLRAWGTWFVLFRAAVRPRWRRGWLDDLPSGYGEIEGWTAFRAQLADDWPGPPLWLIVFDLISGQRRVLGEGGDAGQAIAMADAVLASSAVPGVASPIDVGDQRLCDGGVHSSTNLDLALRGANGPIICIAPICYDPAQPPALIWRLGRAPFQRKLRRELAQVRRAGRLLLLIAPSASDVRNIGANLLSTRRMSRVHEAGYVRAREILAGQEGRALIATVRQNQLATDSLPG